MEKLFEELFDLLEEYINELDDETVNNARNKRANNVEKAMHNFLRARDEGTPEEAEKAKQEWDKAGDKLVNIDKLRNLRGARKEEARKALAKFREKLLNRKPQTFKQTQQAGSDHDNAMIDQYRRNKLEKTFSNECLEEITSLIRESLEEITKKNLEETPIGSKERYKAMSQAVRATTAKTKVRLQRREEGKPALDERPKAERKQATSDYLRRK